MDLFTYLMAKNGNNLSVHGDLFSYLLGKGQSQIYIVSGTTIYIPDAKKLVSFMMTKESTQNTSDIIYVCDGTETGTYYFTYNSINYEFTMPTITSDDVLVFNTETLKLTLNGVEISTTTGTSGTELTFIATPNPDYPQEVNTVKGYKNLWGGLPSDVTRNISEVTFINKQDGSIFVNGTASANAYSLNNTLATNNNHYITLPAGTYTLSGGTNVCRLQIYSGDTVITTIDSPTFTLTEEKNVYIRVELRKDNTADNVTVYPMLIKGNQELPYVPYGNNYIAVNVSDGNTMNKYPIPLNNNEIVGIGNYKDELLVDKSGNVFINKKTGKVILNGLESNWKLQTIESVGHRFYNTNFFTNSVNNQGLCNYMQLGVYDERNDNPGNINNLFYIGDNNIQLRIDNITTLADFKYWLTTEYNNGNPVITYYALETPELIDLQTTVNLKLFKGINTITNSEDGYMTIQYR